MIQFAEQFPDEQGPQQVALLSLGEGSLRVAEYLTALPDHDIMERELFEAIRRSREQIARRSLPSPDGEA